MPTPPATIMLSDDEQLRVADLVRGVRQAESDLWPETFAAVARAYADELPRRVRNAFYRFAREERAPAIIVSGNPEFDSLNRPTPDTIPIGLNEQTLTDDEILHFMYSSLLGDVFTWSTIQNGNIVNYVVPIQANDELPMSSGSKNLFDLHTEDAFRPEAGEYLGLFCIRNEERVATILSYIGDVDLDVSARDRLFLPHFTVSPNIAHEVEGDVQLQSILFGNRDAPYARANFNVRSDDTETAVDTVALNALNEELNICAQNIILKKNEALYIDNYRCLHGRTAFRASYDGTGRWLKRLYIAGSMKQTRALRASATARVVQL